MEEDDDSHSEIDVELVIDHDRLQTDYLTQSGAEKSNKRIESKYDLKKYRITNNHIARNKANDELQGYNAFANKSSIYRVINNTNQIEKDSVREKLHERDYYSNGIEVNQKYISIDDLNEHVSKKHLKMKDYFLHRASLEENDCNPTNNENMRNEDVEVNMTHEQTNTRTHRDNSGQHISQTNYSNINRYPVVDPGALSKMINYRPVSMSINGYTNENRCSEKKRASERSFFERGYWNKEHINNPLLNGLPDRSYRNEVYLENDTPNNFQIHFADPDRYRSQIGYRTNDDYYNQIKGSNAHTYGRKLEDALSISDIRDNISNGANAYHKLRSTNMEDSRYLGYLNGYNHVHGVESINDGHGMMYRNMDNQAYGLEYPIGIEDTRRDFRNVKGYGPIHKLEGRTFIDDTPALASNLYGRNHRLGLHDDYSRTVINNHGYANENGPEIPFKPYQSRGEFVKPRLFQQEAMYRLQRNKEFESTNAYTKYQTDIIKYIPNLEREACVRGYKRACNQFHRREPFNMGRNRHPDIIKATEPRNLTDTDVIPGVRIYNYVHDEIHRTNTANLSTNPPKATVRVNNGTGPTTDILMCKPGIPVRTYRPETVILSTDTLTKSHTSNTQNRNIQTLMKTFETGNNNKTELLSSVCKDKLCKQCEIIHEDCNYFLKDEACANKNCTHVEALLKTFQSDHNNKLELDAKSSLSEGKLSTNINKPQILHKEIKYFNNDTTSANENCGITAIEQEMCKLIEISKNKFFLLFFTQIKDLIKAAFPVLAMCIQKQLDRLGQVLEDGTVKECIKYSCPLQCFVSTYYMPSLQDLRNYSNTETYENYKKMCSLCIVIQYYYKSYKEKYFDLLLKYFGDGESVDDHHCERRSVIMSTHAVAVEKHNVIKKEDYRTFSKEEETREPEHDDKLETLTDINTLQTDLFFQLSTFVSNFPKETIKSIALSTKSEYDTYYKKEDSKYDKVFIKEEVKVNSFKDISKKSVEDINATVPANGNQKNEDCRLARSRNAKPDEVYTCPICSCIFVYSASFICHMQTHDVYDIANEISDDCIAKKCPFCGIYSKKKSHNDHVRRSHPEIFNFKKSNEMQKAKVDKRKKSNKRKFVFICLVCNDKLRSYEVNAHRESRHRGVNIPKMFTKKLSNPGMA